MSQHPSLKSSNKTIQHRSVLKRFEKIKVLKDKDKWTDGNSAFGLPKVKTLRFKIKKEKAAPAAEETAAGSEEKKEPSAAKEPAEKKSKAKTA